MKPEEIPMLREWFTTKAEPMIRHHITNEVRQALDAVQPNVTSTVLKRLQDLPRLMFESIKFPSMDSDEDSKRGGEENFLDMLESMSPFLGAEDFDWNAEINNPMLPVLEDSADPSDLSDSSGHYRTGGSSATSAQNESAEENEYKVGALPEPLDPTFGEDYYQSQWY